MMIPVRTAVTDAQTNAMKYPSTSLVVPDDHIRGAPGVPIDMREEVYCCMRYSANGGHRPSWCGATIYVLKVCPLPR